MHVDVYLSFACTYVYALYACLVVKRDGRGHWIPGNWNCRQLWATMRVLGTEPCSFRREAGTLNWCIISIVCCLFIYSPKAINLFYFPSTLQRQMSTKSWMTFLALKSANIISLLIQAELEWCSAYLQEYSCLLPFIFPTVLQLWIQFSPITSFFIFQPLFKHFLWPKPSLLPFCPLWSTLFIMQDTYRWLISSNGIMPILIVNLTTSEII